MPYLVCYYLIVRILLHISYLGYTEPVIKLCNLLSPVLNIPLSVAVGGQEPIRPYYTPRDRAGNPINILKVKPKTDLSRCGGCGLCAELCPMGSIDPADVSQVKGICIKCCACVKGCPTGAKYFDDPGYLYHKSELEEVYARPAKNEVFL